jgi:alpha-glucosidase
LRYRLLPYLYTALHQACTEGIPMMRPLVLEFPRDPTVINLSDEYLFGSELLVAPVVDEGSTQRKVYLPEGGWIDFWNERSYAGPGWIEVSAPLDTLPLYVRQGAIIPCGPDVQYSSQRALDPLTIEIYPGADRSFTLYEDDGETLAYQNGQWAETPIVTSEEPGIFTCRLDETRGDFDVAKCERTVIMNIHCQASVRAVRCDAIVLAEMPDSKSIENVPTGWWWDKARQILTIKLRRGAQALTLRVDRD